MVPWVQVEQSMCENMTGRLTEYVYMTTRTMCGLRFRRTRYVSRRLEGTAIAAALYAAIGAGTFDRLTSTSELGDF